MIFNLFSSNRNTVKACDYSNVSKEFNTSAAQTESLKVSRDSWLVGTIYTSGVLNNEHTRIIVNGVTVAEALATYGTSASGRTIINLFVKAGSNLSIHGASDLKLYRCLA